MDQDAIPVVLDCRAPNGRIATRREQIRVTPLRGDVTVAVALERSGQDVDPGELRELDPTLASSLQSGQKLPDLAARVPVTGDLGHVQLAGILRPLAWDTKATPSNEPRGSATGWGLAATSAMKVVGKDRVRLSVSGGRGIAAVMNDGGVDIAAKGAAGSATGVGVPLYPVMAYYEHACTDTLVTTVGYSGVIQDNTSLQTASAFKRGQYTSANVLVTPVKNLLLGVEALWGQREDKGGATGDDVRIQISARFAFSSLTSP